jgi:hypothetical protein
MRVLATQRSTERPLKISLHIRRELGQVSLDHIDEHRRKGDDA